MKKIRQIFIATLLISSLISCSKSDDSGNGGSSIPIEGVSFTVGGITTKAAIEQFSTDNEVGIQAYSTDGSLHKVATYSYNQDGIFVSADPIEYSTKNPSLSYIAIHPNICGESTHFYAYVGKNQSIAENYINSDFIVAKKSATDDEQPQLDFYHIMCNFQVKINVTKAGEAYPYSDVMFNAIIQQECDLVNENYTIIKDAIYENITPAALEDNNYGIIVASQTATLADGFATLKIDGETIVMSDETLTEIILAWGHQVYYEWNITLESDKIIQTVEYIGGSIQDWTENDEVEAPDTTVGEPQTDAEFDGMIDGWGTTDGEPEVVSYDWDGIAIPVTASAGYEWVLLESLSDDFNYESSNSNMHATFSEKWTDYYHNAWTGPAPTYWQRDHISVSGGDLRIIATRPDDVPQLEVTSGDNTATMDATYTGCITSTSQVSYPAYIEAYAQLSNSTMASDVWLLSADDTQEIDIIEAYGSDRSTGTSSNYYGAEYLHLSHHVFVRDPFEDYQPTDTGSWYRDGNGTKWRDDYHRVGVYWKDAWTLEYYVDGQLVRTVSGSDMIDPYDYTEGTGLVKDMDIIINMEDQSWRAIGGMSPTDAELTSEANCTFKVDWIRVYKLTTE